VIAKKGLPKRNFHLKLGQPRTIGSNRGARSFALRRSGQIYKGSFVGVFNVIGCSESSEKVGTVDLHLIRGGVGSSLLVLHDELGFPGWLTWNENLASDYEQIIPFQPGYGKTKRQGWMTSYRDLAGFYSRWIRETKGAPIDVLAFSAGAYVAAEMVAADPSLFRRMILVAPLGIRPEEGFIFDFLAVTIRSHVVATVSRYDCPEFGKIYGGDMTPEQFELFEEARSETARLGWEPFMYNPSLPHLLEGILTPTLLVRGTEDQIVPKDCVTQYARVLCNSQIAEFQGSGHRPEIEDENLFTRSVKEFLER